MHRIRIIVSLFLLCSSLASAQYWSEKGYVSDAIRDSASAFEAVLFPEGVPDHCGVASPYGVIYGSFSHPEAFEAIYITLYGNYSTGFSNRLFRRVDETWQPVEAMGARVSGGMCIAQNTLEHKDILICLDDNTDNLWNHNYFDEGRSLMQLFVHRFAGNTSSTETLLYRENFSVNDRHADEFSLEICDATQPYHSYYDTPRLSTKDNNMDGLPDIVLTVRHHLITECYNDSDTVYAVMQEEREAFQGEWVDYEMVWLFDGLGYTPMEETVELLEHIESFAAIEAPYVVDRSFTGK